MVTWKQFIYPLPKTKQDVGLWIKHLTTTKPNFFIESHRSSISGATFHTMKTLRRLLVSKLLAKATSRQMKWLSFIYFASEWTSLFSTQNHDIVTNYNTCTKKEQIHFSQNLLHTESVQLSTKHYVNAKLLKYPSVVLKISRSSERYKNAEELQQQHKDTQVRLVEGWALIEAPRY